MMGALRDDDDLENDIRWQGRSLFGLITLSDRDTAAMSPLSVFLIPRSIGYSGSPSPSVCLSVCMYVFPHGDSKTI